MCLLVALNLTLISLISWLFGFASTAVLSLVLWQKLSSSGRTHHSQKCMFMHQISLDTSPESRDWICKTDDIDHKWHNFFHNDPKAHPNHCCPWLPIFCLDHTKRQLDIKTDEDALVYDETFNELLMVVICNFGRDTNLLKHIEGIIKQSVDCWKSIRVSNSFHS